MRTNAIVGEYKQTTSRKKNSHCSFNKTFLGKNIEHKLLYITKMEPKIEPHQFLSQITWVAQRTYVFALINDFQFKNFWHVKIQFSFSNWNLLFITLLPFGCLPSSFYQIRCLSKVWNARKINSTEILDLCSIWNQLFWFHLTALKIVFTCKHKCIIFKYLLYF
jgi:hypothetical protein